MTYIHLIMQRKSLGNSQCPIARGLDRVGEWWSILILRDAFYGLSRFDEFQKSLDIAPNMLTRRLTSLVETGLLERHQYTDKPPRFEYRLTDRGRDFWPVLMSLMAWGNRQFADEGIAMTALDAATGDVVEPIVVDRKTGKELTEAAVKIAAGPAAGERMRQRLNAIKTTC